jgi:hypothetical protein
MKIVSRVKNHKKIKNNLLSIIKNSHSNSYQNISNTDWNLNEERKYSKIFLENIKENMNYLANKLSVKNWEIDSLWFQQYLKNDEHDWHTHVKTHFANVYYLELPSKELVTEFIDGEKIKAKEGDLVTFPAYILHRSALNKTNKRKTIISFNSSFY